MGTHKRILSERAIEPCMYSDWPLTIEQRETIHFHYRNWRPVLTKQQFLLLAAAVEDARHKFREIGSPEKMDDGPTLGAVRLTPPLHANRVALEECTDDTIHLHFDDMRLHMDPRTFYRLSLIFQEAFARYCKHNVTTINIADRAKVAVSKHALELYMPWLEEFRDDVDPDSFLDAFLDMRKLARPEDEQRYSDGWWKDPNGKEIRSKELSREDDKKYLFHLFASIKKYGYGKGPFQYNYMRVIRKPREEAPDGILVTGSHRAACLLKLGYTDVPVVVTN